MERPNLFFFYSTPAFSNESSIAACIKESNDTHMFGLLCPSKRGRTSDWHSAASVAGAGFPAHHVRRNEVPLPPLPCAVGPENDHAVRAARGK